MGNGAPESRSDGLEASAAGDQPIQVRAQAARELIVAGQLDPAVALSYVVWPTKRLEALPAPGRRQERSAEQREQVLALVDAGVSQPKITEQTGVPYGTIKMWVRMRGPELSADGPQKRLSDPSPRAHFQ